MGQELALKDKDRYEREMSSYVPPLKYSLKKPPGPYAMFFKDLFPEFKSQHPDKSVTEISPLIAQKWKETPQSSKDKYKSKYESMMQDYLVKKKQVEESE